MYYMYYSQMLSFSFFSSAILSVLYICVFGITYLHIKYVLHTYNTLTGWISQSDDNYKIIILKCRIMFIMHSLS